MSDPVSIERALERLLAEQRLMDELMASGSFAALGGKLATLDARDLRRLIAYMVAAKIAAEKSDTEESEEAGAAALHVWVLRGGGEAQLVKLFGDGQSPAGRQRRGGKKGGKRRR